MSRSKKRSVYFRIICSTLCICFQFNAFVRKRVWPKDLLMGYSMRIELNLVCSFKIYTSLRKASSRKHPRM